MIMKQKPKFRLGQMCSTPGALEAMNDAGQSPMVFVGRHVQGDWGEVCADDQQANEEALDSKLRLLSAYPSLYGSGFLTEGIAIALFGGCNGEVCFGGRG